MGNGEQVAPRRVSDVAPSGGSMEGNLIRVRELEGKEFVITAIGEWEKDGDPYLAVQIELGGKVCFFFSSHKAVMDKLRKCVNDLPLVATITKHTSKKLGREYFDIE